MSHDREQLIGYVYGECDADERRAIERHLDDCDVCREDIRDLRRMREDLLAWEVPAHGSVWTPFAPLSGPPWWRQVPAWAMAAAASVMFVMGAAGGVVGQALTAASPVAQAAFESGGDRVVPAGITADDLTAAERRILLRLREELVAQATANDPAATMAAVRRVSASSGVGLEQLAELRSSQADLRDRTIEWISGALNEHAGFRDKASQRIEKLEKDLERIALSNVGYGGPGGR